MATPLHILIVEDSPDDAELLVAQLRRAGFAPQWQRVETEPDFLAALETQPDLILSDYSLPGFTGLHAAELLQASGLDIPFILISGTVGEDTAVEAMKRGATDYLLKDRLSRLGQAIEQALEKKRLRADYQRTEESLKLFRTLLDQSSDGIEVVDPETGRFLDVNQTTCLRLGYTHAEMLAMRVADVEATAVSASTWRETVQEIRRSGFKFVEGRHRRKDGSTFPIEVNVRYVRLDREYLIASVRDISGRRLAEDKMRQLSHALEQSPAVVIITDTKGNMEYVNRKFTELTGYSAAEALGENPRLLKSGEMSEEVYRTMWQTIRQGDTWTGEFHNRKKNGELYWEAACISPMLDETGKPTHYVAVKEDMTERRRASEQLRESEERFRQLAENINEVFWMTDPTMHQVIYVSPAYEKIWGRSCASLYAAPRQWEEAIHPDDHERVLTAARAILVSGTYDVEYRVLRPDQTERWIHDRGFPVRNAAGEIYRIVGTAVDITQRKILEEQFRQSQKMEAIGQLAGGVAHDFNNILAVMQMQADLLKVSGHLSDAQKDFVEEIANTVQRAAALTRQLLLFSRREVFQPCALDLNEAITGTVKMLRRILGEHIEMRLNLAARPMLLQADAGMLDQVLMNLAVNARDAMVNGGQLVIETAGVEFAGDVAAPARPGAFVCLCVSDTGCGIPPENLAKIFDPFFTTKDVGKGTGLGLATVFGIVQQHHGWIGVESECGHGTTFHIYLPQRPAQPRETSPPTPPLARYAGHETILLVEDESSLRRAVCKILGQLGYRILEAASGLQALEIWQEHRAATHLLLTDLVMPGNLSGRALALRLRQDNPKLKVVFTSGYSPEIAGPDFPMQTGVNFLAKPFQMHALAQIIRDSLDQGTSDT